jgi:putative FmdB family regulatory protein
MPIYEYRCQACEHLLEAFQKLTEAPLRTCPKCKRKRLERLLSASAFHLKGGGWYKDGYGSSKPAASTPSTPSGKDSTPSTPSTKGESAASSTKSGSASNTKATTGSGG